MTGDELKQRIDALKGFAVVDIADELGYSRDNLYKLMDKDELPPETGRKIEMALTRLEGQWHQRFADLKQGQHN